MATGRARIVAGELRSPTPVADGVVVDIDQGVPGSIILTLKRDGEVFYETYELARVEAATDLRGT